MNATRLHGSPAPQGRIRLGTDAHKELFCRMLLDTYDPYKPAAIDWPVLDEEALQRLTGLPFWHVAVTTEGNAALRMQTMAEETPDPLMKEALELNAFEERRHKDVIENLIRSYGITIGPEPPYRRPKNPERAYIQTGYGECFDSFFAFGLFRLASDSGFFPPDLVEVFEPIMQEEARHILFFVNWVAYMRAHTLAWQRPVFTGKCVAAFVKKARSRMGLAKSKPNKNSSMTRKGHKSLKLKLSPRKVIDICLEENDRRMARYDPRLVRPQMVPRLARFGRRFV